MSAIEPKEATAFMVGLFVGVIIMICLILIHVSPGWRGDVIVGVAGGFVCFMIGVAWRAERSDRMTGETVEAPNSKMHGIRCPACKGDGMVYVYTRHDQGWERCGVCKGTGKRSGPANADLSDD